MKIWTDGKCFINKARLYRLSKNIESVTLILSNIMKLNDEIEMNEEEIKRIKQ
jgi:hypothetical protein